MTHDCPTGWHHKPSANCYESHRCRCNGCRDLKSRRNRHSRRSNRRRVTINVDSDTWTTLVNALRNRGLTVDEWIAAAAYKLGGDAA